MASRNSPAKVTLAMIKGKPIATSVPSIRYHASDDELEELYPSTDDEKQTPESEKSSPKSSPRKSTGEGEKSENDGNEDVCDKRSASVDGSISEGTPPTDPWKMFTDFKGKLTKTFEEKLSEIKSDKRNKLKRRSGENSSFSDSEDLGDVTPTEDFIPEKQQESLTLTGGVRRRSGSSRFAGFTNIKTGLKAKTPEDDCSVESGVEAAELADESITTSSTYIPGGGAENNEETDSFVAKRSENQAGSRVKKGIFTSDGNTPKRIFSRLMRQLFCQLVAIPFVLVASYHVIPLPDYWIGYIAGIFVILMLQNAMSRVKNILAIEPETNAKCPIVEIPAVEEHAVVEKFEGWLNELPYAYDPENYHVARTSSVMFKLEGDSLRVMETRTRIPKRAAWNEPQHHAKFTRKRVYSLAGATVELLPEGLTRRRRWSKKYPLCVTFGKEGVIENIDLKKVSEDEAQKTDDDKERIIFEKSEDEDEEDEEDLSQSRDKKKDVFADCRDDDDDDDDDDNDDDDVDDDVVDVDVDVDDAHEDDNADDNEDEEDEKSKLKIYVFARTDRQKEDWYRRLKRATSFSSKRNSISSQKDTSPSSNPPSTVLATVDTKNSNSTATANEVTSELSYNAYMTRYTDAQSTPTTEIGGSLAYNDVVWLNALLGRVLFDMHKSPDTIKLIQEKIQRKLSNIKLPYFMESLLISELVIGQGAPVIHKATKPVIDEHGLSVDLDITYEGCLTMTIETKLNLIKLTRTGSVSTNDIASNDRPKPARSPMFDSDVEDSPETSTEEEDNTTLPSNSGSRESTPTQSSGRKFLNMVDKLTANKYFQSATELSCVRRAMEGLSNTEISLMVNVSSIKGFLTVNIPPPPSDRIWYGFKPVPQIILTAKPAVGERAVNIGYVTKWIETKLLKEFERVVVLPNMDDIMISLCPNYPFHKA